MSDMAEMVKTAAKQYAKTCFTSECSMPEERKEEEALGILIAQAAEYYGDIILRVFRSALEDANFHREAAEVEKMIKRVNRE